MVVITGGEKSLTFGDNIEKGVSCDRDVEKEAFVLHAVSSERPVGVLQD